VARAVATEMHAGFATLRQQLPMDIRAMRSVPHRVALAGDDIARLTALWRDCITRFGQAGANGAGPFLFGAYCIADAMFAPAATRLHTYAVPLDPISAAYVAAQREWPAMCEWRDAAEREPWTIAYDLSGTTPY
jgi:glutathione S-transferase